MSHLEHKAQAAGRVRCAVLTVSDTRTDATDTGGAAIVSILAGAGHPLAARDIVRDEPDQVRARVEAHIASPEVDAVIVTGGTGISSRDRTVDTVSALFDLRLDGFGELFRVLSFEAIGPAAMLSRACAGVAGGTVIFLLPGSEAAVRLAMDRLILPELPHLVREVRR